MKRVFLSAEWRHLAMINYAIDPKALQPFVPAGTEVDSFEGVTYISLVGFQFLKTSVLGLRFPFHHNFEEVNLRFYVRAKSEEGWRRGVVFVRELVPRRAIAWVARLIYGEPYLAVPMRHRVHVGIHAFAARYEWFHRRRWQYLEVTGTGAPAEITIGSLEEFISEHYWGFTRRARASTQYQVEHPRWRVWNGALAKFDADVANLYGPAFVESLSAAPRSAFLAEGSPVTVLRHTPTRS